MTSGTTTAGLADLAIADVQWLGRLARRLADDSDDADDLAQETLVAAWSQPAERSEEARRPWLVAVLRNRLRMLRRSRGRRDERERAAVAPDATREPDAELERLEVVRCLLQELEALGPEDRMIVVRRFFDGEDATEIGRALAMPAATVRSRIHRTLQRLRTRLDQRFGDRRTWCAALGLVPKVGGEQAANDTGDTTMSTTTIMAKGLIACTIAVAAGGVAWAATRDTPDGEHANESATATATATPTDDRTARIAENRQRWEERRTRIRASIPRGAMPKAPAPRATAGGYRGLVTACLEDLESEASGALTLQVTEIGAPDVGVIYDDVVIVETTVDDEAVLTCITESMYAFVGDAPIEGYERNSQRTMQIGASKEPDVVDQRMFDAIVGAHISEVRHCQTKVAEGEASGTLDVAITVGVDQLATKVDIVDSTLPAPVQTCIVGAMQRWLYPKPLIGETLEYGYALPLAGR